MPQSASCVKQISHSASSKAHVGHSLLARLHPPPNALSSWPCRSGAGLVVRQAHQEAKAWDLLGPADKPSPAGDLPGVALTSEQVVDGQGSAVQAWCACKAGPPARRQAVQIRQQGLPQRVGCQLGQRVGRSGSLHEGRAASGPGPAASSADGAGTGSGRVQAGSGGVGRGTAWGRAHPRVQVQLSSLQSLSQRGLWVEQRSHRAARLHQVPWQVPTAVFQAPQVERVLAQQLRAAAPVSQLLRGACASSLEPRGGRNGRPALEPAAQLPRGRCAGSSTRLRPEDGHDQRQALAEGRDVQRGAVGLVARWRRVGQEEMALAANVRRRPAAQQCLRGLRVPVAHRQVQGGKAQGRRRVHVPAATRLRPPPGKRCRAPRWRGRAAAGTSCCSLPARHSSLRALLPWYSTVGQPGSQRLNSDSQLDSVLSGPITSTEPLGPTPPTPRR